MCVVVEIHNLTSAKPYNMESMRDAYAYVNKSVIYS